MAVAIQTRQALPRWSVPAIEETQGRMQAARDERNMRAAETRRRRKADRA